MKIINALSVLTCALLLHTNAQAGEILIDDFSTGQGVEYDNKGNPDYTITDYIVGSGGTSNQVSSSGGDILGGYRDIYVEVNDNGVGISAGGSPQKGVVAEVSEGDFTVSHTSKVKGVVVVTYDGENDVGNDWASGVDTDGLGGQDWTGTTGFLLDDVFSSGVIESVQFIVWTDDDNNSLTENIKHVFEFDADSETNNEGLYNDLISVVELNGYDYINWASVGAFQAIFNLASNPGDKDSVDLTRIGRAVAVEVPEPAALSMFGAGMLMLGFVGSRRRKNQ